MEKPTEESLFLALCRAQKRQRAAVVRHASVGEVFQYATAGKAGRAQHSVRRIDALVIKRNASKGDVLWAVEIKVSASDLRSEIGDPGKTEAWAQYVNFFYFLVPPELLGLALEIIPPQYGVMVGSNWCEIKRKARRNPSPLPLPLDTWRRLAGKLGEYQSREIVEGHKMLRGARSVT